MVRGRPIKVNGKPEDVKDSETVMGKPEDVKDGEMVRGIP
ncbi:hypothetical protein A2U01_0062500, partial [Trifolium medium]|nr:hypothetical protein [Trifolium medium]